MRSRRFVGPDGNACPVLKRPLLTDLRSLRVLIAWFPYPQESINAPALELNKGAEM